MAVSDPIPWIPLSKYMQDLPDRAGFNELDPSMSYSLMERMRPNKYKQEALRREVKLTSVERIGDIAVIQFVFPDACTLPIPKEFRMTEQDELPPPIRVLNNKVQGGFLLQLADLGSGDIRATEAYLSFDTSTYYDDLDSLFTAAPILVSAER